MAADDERLRWFEALVHASPDFIALAGVDGKVEFVNEAGRRLIGLDPAVDVSLLTIADFLTPEGIRASQEVEQPAVVRDGVWTGESTLRDWRDDSAIPVSITSFVLSDLTTGEPIALATIQHDLREVQSVRAVADAASAELERSAERQRALLLHMFDLVFLVDADLTLLYASPSASRILGFPEGSMIGKSVVDLVHPEEKDDAVRVLVAIAKAPGESRTLPVRVINAAGEVVHYEGRANNLLAEPTVGGIIITIRDVTDAHRADVSQRDVSRVLELIAAEAPVASILESVAHWVQSQMPGIRCTILLTEAGVPHRTLHNGASPSMPEAYRQAIEGVSVANDAVPCAVAVARSEPVLVEDVLADARWAPMHPLADLCGVRSCWSYPITSPASGATLGSFAIISGTPSMPDEGAEQLIARASHLVGITVDRRRLLDRLEHQAHHDALTTLPNRVQLLERLTEALGRCEDGGLCPVVLFLDLDRLKVINDSLGHEVGDELLIRIAARLRDAVGPGDLIARFGGDEFVVLATSLTTEGEVIALAETVLSTISETVQLEGRSIAPAASLGVVVASPGQTASAVLRDADIAMYRAKQRGGGGYELFGEHMRQRAFDRLDLEGQIRHGIERGEFRLFYQPLVELRKGDRLVGFEALLRWEHPERGLLMPGSFLQLAEETGLIVPIGDWVLRTAVAQAISWNSEVSTEGLTMSVNVAAQQLGSAGLVPLVAESVRALGPWSLGLELTESTLMDNTADVLRTIDELSAAGARLSIDDFGTGFSSLSYLTRLPVRRLKIDQSFIADLDAPSKAASTVASAIISMAAQLGLTAIAEGIETAEQRDTLLEMGCRYGQGYLFSRPVPADQALALIRRR
jgi:diguanylate cyclase (GGDEF)-like protein/PAS domain S-box-containing protein